MYQEYEEHPVRKKREEAAAAVETEEEIAMRSYGSRLRSFPSHFCSVESFSSFLMTSFSISRYECGPARRFLDDFEQLHYLDRWTDKHKSKK